MTSWLHTNNAYIECLVETELLHELIAYVETFSEPDKVKKAAEFLNISPKTLKDTLTGKNAPDAEVIQAFGYKQTCIYTKLPKKQKNPR